MPELSIAVEFVDASTSFIALLFLFEVLSLATSSIKSLLQISLLIVSILISLVHFFSA
jgi:hypothetical protein